MTSFLESSSYAPTDPDPALEREERVHLALLRFIVPCILTSSMEQRHSLVLSLLKQLGLFLQLCDKHERSATLFKARRSCSLLSVSHWTTSFHSRCCTSTCSCASDCWFRFSRLYVKLVLAGAAV